LPNRGVEHRLAGLDLNQAKAHQVADGRLQQPAVADRAQEFNAGHAAAGLGERCGVAPGNGKSPAHQ